MSDKAMLVLGEASESDDEDFQQIEVRSAIDFTVMIKTHICCKKIMINFRTQEVEWLRATTQSLTLIPNTRQAIQVCRSSYLYDYSLLQNTSCLVSYFNCTSTVSTHQLFFINENYCRK